MEQCHFIVYDTHHTHALMYTHTQLVEKENVRAVISYNEAYELRYFTNSKKVGHLLSVYAIVYVHLYMYMYVHVCVLCVCVCGNLYFFLSKSNNVLVMRIHCYPRTNCCIACTMPIPPQDIVCSSLLVQDKPA